jgi:hypothetical protein
LGLAIIFILPLLAACVPQQSWPPAAGQTLQERPAVAAHGGFPYCPRQGSFVNRRLIVDGRAFGTIRYVGGSGAGPCIVSGGGSTRFFDALGFLQTADAAQAQAMSRATERLFPLEVGRRSEVVIGGTAARTFTQERWRYSFEVARSEVLEFGFGRFPTFVITVDERGEFPNLFHRQHAVWIEPETRLPVRVVRRLIRGLPEGVLPDWEATGFGPRQASRPN